MKNILGNFVRNIVGNDCADNFSSLSENQMGKAITFFLNSLITCLPKLHKVKKCLHDHIQLNLEGNLNLLI